MQNLESTFKVGEVNGQKVNKEFPFKYRKFDSWDEVVVAWKSGDLLDQINSYEKASAKANEYQKVTEPYRPDTSSPEYKREQTIKNLVDVFKIDRKLAEQQVDAMIAAAKEVIAEEAAKA